MDKAQTVNSSSSERVSYTNGNGVVKPYSHLNDTVESDHFVQFYEDDGFLLDSLHDFIGKGLDSGDACIVVATQAHRDALDLQLQRSGRDLIPARSSGHYFTVDAAETISKFMAGGFPDPGKFEDVIGTIIKGVAAPGRRVRIFGEMVALLIAEQKSEAAIEVERLWNNLNQIYPFILFCAYRLDCFVGDEFSETFQRVCNGHSRVFPSESFSNLTVQDDQLRAITLLQQKAASLEAEIKERQVLEENLRAVKDELEIQLDDMRRLHKMSIGLIGTIELDSVLEEVLVSALAVQGTNMGFLSLFETDRAGLAIKVQHGFDQDVIEQIEFAPDGKGFFGDCLTERRRVIVEDVETDPIFECFRTSARIAGFRAFHSTPLIDRSGNVIGVLSVHFPDIHRPSEREIRLVDMYARMAADIIEHARLHQQLREKLDEREHLLKREKLARAEAETANSLRDEFLATVSHELRTPLTAIIGWSSMYLKHHLEEENKIRAVETIAKSANAQARLIDDLLDVSRIISGKLRLNIGPVDLITIINSAADTLQPAADSKSIVIEVVFDSFIRVIMGDSNRLQQIVWNLLSNAIKFTPPYGRIIICLRNSETDVEIEICDTGQGIKPEFLPFVFDRLRQADGSRTRRHGGLGLGLSIVKQLVELHGGVVRAESPGEDCGSTFTVKLPINPVYKNLKSPGENSPFGKTFEKPNIDIKSNTSLRGLKILLVDDNQETLKMLSFILAEYESSVKTADSVEKALKIFETFDPDVLISDLGMPGEDGFSLIGKIRVLESAGKKHIPAIALSAFIRTEDRELALFSGFDTFVEKPVEVDKLLTAIVDLVTPN